jgi:L-serine dehydratase
MNSGYPSIFNDVIGPVMRGPSSSHCAAALRIGRIARDVMDGVIDEVWIAFDPKGSLAETHHTQGSDMGLFGGLLGWEADDERLIDSATAIHEAGIKVHIEIRDYGAVHPNTYRLKLKNSVETRCMIAVSKGGGTIEVVEIDGVPLSVAGDCFETLVYISGSAQGVFSFVSESVRRKKSSSALERKQGLSRSRRGNCWTMGSVPGSNPKNRCSASKP